jgi:hypothetical protein
MSAAESAYINGAGRDLAITVMLGHAVELREVGVGEWNVMRHEILMMPDGLEIAHTLEPFGGETDEGRIFCTDEAIIGAIIRSARLQGVQCLQPPGRN